MADGSFKAVQIKSLHYKRLPVSQKHKETMLPGPWAWGGAGKQVCGRARPPSCWCRPRLCPHRHVSPPCRACFQPAGDACGGGADRGAGAEKDQAHAGGGGWVGGWAWWRSHGARVPLLACANLPLTVLPDVLPPLAMPPHHRRCQVRKGMVLVAPSANPKASWEFDADIAILTHQTTIQPRYQVGCCLFPLSFFHLFSVGPLFIGLRRASIHRAPFFPCATRL